MKDEALENSLIYQYNNGWSIRRLSREYHVSCRRISRILKENARRRSEGTQDEVKPSPRSSKLDAYKDYIHELHGEFKKEITVQRIFELILEKGYDGKISILEDYVAKIRKTRVKEVIRCVETAPGYVN